MGGSFELSPSGACCWTSSRQSVRSALQTGGPSPNIFALLGIPACLDCCCPKQTNNRGRLSLL